MDLCRIYESGLPANDCFDSYLHSLLVFFLSNIGLGTVVRSGAGHGWPSVPVAKDGEKGPSRKLYFLTREKKQPRTAAKKFNRIGVISRNSGN